MWLAVCWQQGAVLACPHRGPSCGSRALRPNACACCNFRQATLPQGHKEDSHAQWHPASRANANGRPRGGARGLQPDPQDLTTCSLCNATISIACLGLQPVRSADRWIHCIGMPNDKFRDLECRPSDSTIQSANLKFNDLECRPSNSTIGGAGRKKADAYPFACFRISW